MTSEQRVRDALATCTDDFAVRGEVMRTDRHAVREVGFEGRRAVCKLARTDDATGLRRDALVLRRLADDDAETDAVPTPDLLARGEEFYVASFAPGREYDGDAPRAVRERRLRDAGATLAAIHDALSLPAHGDLRPAGDRLDLDARGSWPDLFAAWVADWREDLAGTPFADLGDDVLAFVSEHAGAFSAAGPPVLVHGDYEADNLRFAGGGVAAVLDWEVARAAPGEFDLARAELGLFEKPDSPVTDGDLRAALRSGYESVRPLPDGFDARRAAYRAALTLKPLRRLAAAGSGTDAPDDDDRGPTVDDLGPSRGDLGPSRDDLGASMERFVRDRLDAARSALR